MNYPRNLIVLLSIVFPAIARADSLVINNIPYKDVRISAVKGDEIYFTVGGNEVRKPFAQVSKIVLNDELAFNAAEDAFAAKQWDKAVEGYDKTLRTTQKQWLKDWIAVRLLEAANNTGRFDASVKGWIALAEKTPDVARAVQLKMPQADSAYLTEGINLINAAIAKTKNTPTKEALLDLLLSLQNAKGDMKGANDALQRRLELKAADPNSADAPRAGAMLKLKAIQLALAGKEYDKAIQIAEKEGSVFYDPADQAEALFMLAEAKAGKAGDSKDAETWKEVALAYMRVVVNCPASAAQVPAALLKTAAIHEKQLGEKETALRIYQQVASDYKGHEPAKQAEKEIARLK